MTHDDIIKLAREAGYEIQCLDGIDEVMDGDGYLIQTDQIERFATLVEAAAIDKAHKSFCAELRQMHDAYALSSHPGVLRTRGKTK